MCRRVSARPSKTWAWAALRGPGSSSSTPRSIPALAPSRARTAGSVWTIARPGRSSRRTAAPSYWMTSALAAENVWSSARRGPSRCAGARILSSVDPVAIDKASADLAIKHGKSDVFRKGYDVDWMLQLRHGAKIGLGSFGYELVEIDD